MSTLDTVTSSVAASFNFIRCGVGISLVVETHGRQEGKTDSQSMATGSDRTSKY